MYIKLGNTSIQNVITESQNPYIIAAEVIDSGLSFETPTLITSTSELGALFSTDFSDYKYLRNLLSRGIGLYLFSPFSPKISESILGQEDYIDYSDYKVLKDIHGDFSPPIEYVEYLNQWKKKSLVLTVLYQNRLEYYFFNQDTNALEKVTDLGNEVWLTEGGLEFKAELYKGEAIRETELDKFQLLKTSDKICIDMKGVLWVWAGDAWGFMKESLLPQNQSSVETSKSLDKRSTLLISEQGYNLYPEFRVGLGLRNYFSPDIPGLEDISQVNIDRVNLGEKQVIVQLKISEDLQIKEDSEYDLGFYFQDNNGKHYISISTKSEINKDLYPEELTKLVRLESSDKVLETIQESIDSLGLSLKTLFDKEHDCLYVIGPNISIVYEDTFPGLSINYGDAKLTQAVLMNSLKNLDGIHIWSKTIGGTNELDNAGRIRVQIRDGNSQGEYVFTISRYEYVESFSGYINGEPGRESIDKIIEKNSRLIHIKFSGKMRDELPIGEYYLSPGEKLLPETNLDWLNSLKVMFDEDYQFKVNPDFLLIPDFKKFITTDTTTRHPEEYQLLWEYCCKGNFQALIQNNDSVYSYKQVPSPIPALISRTPNTVYYITEDGNETLFLSLGKTLDLGGSDEVVYDSESDELIKEDLSLDTIRKVVVKSSCEANSELKIVYKKTSADSSKLYIKLYNLSSHNFKVTLARIREDGKMESSTKCEFEPNASVGLLLSLNQESYRKPEIVSIRSYNCSYFCNSNRELNRIVDRGIIQEAFCGGDFVHNCVDEKENRFLYFYRPIQSIEGGYMMPAYSLFLHGILTGNYSGESTKILYDNPTENPYDNSSKKEALLTRFRSNFLVFDGRRYFYKNYLEHSEKTTSIYLRFILGKITRELENLKSKLVGLRGSIIQTYIEEVLKKIENTFSIVSSIRVTHYNLNLSENKLDIELETSVNNLVEKNIRLNITLNLK